MNQNILDRIQQWLAEGKTPEWIAEELNFEDNTIDYYDVLNKANEIWEASKPKKKSRARKWFRRSNLGTTTIYECRFGRRRFIFAIATDA